MMYIWDMILEKVKKQGRVDAKYVHITLHKISSEDRAFWLKKALAFRSNVVAVLVGLEENQEEGKGLHVHIFIQFSTRQKLSRKQFIDHFGTDSIHIGTRKSKDDLMQGLGYVSKTGNTRQEGVFTYRGVELSTDPETYRFSYEVQCKDDAIKYFQKVIKEHIGYDKNIIKKYAKRDDAIGRYLVGNITLANSLHKLAYTWYLDHANEQKRGFKFASFVDDPVNLRGAYRAYIKDFSGIFDEHLPKDSDLRLEKDYDQHESHDLEVLRRIIVHLGIAKKYGHARPHKSLNLCIWSRAPSFGKTRLLTFLDDHMMAYRLPDDQYYVDYESGLYQVLVSDEAASFLRTKDYSHLKHILEGKRVEFNLKGREKTYKEDNPLIILADNVSFDTLMNQYHKAYHDRSVMDTRVLDLELKSRATLHFFIDRCLITND